MPIWRLYFQSKLQIYLRFSHRRLSDVSTFNHIFTWICGLHTDDCLTSLLSIIFSHKFTGFTQMPVWRFYFQSKLQIYLRFSHRCLSDVSTFNHIFHKFAGFTQMPVWRLYFQWKLQIYLRASHRFMSDNATFSHIFKWIYGFHTDACLTFLLSIIILYT